MIFEIILERDDYKALEVSFKRKGYGQSLGVYDRKSERFYECSGMAQHWRTIRNIVQECYPEIHEALESMYIDSKLSEYDGYSRSEIELFVMTNFELVGGMKSVNEYL